MDWCTIFPWWNIVTIIHFITWFTAATIQGWPLFNMYTCYLSWAMRHKLVSNQANDFLLKQLLNQFLLWNGRGSLTIKLSSPNYHCAILMCEVCGLDQYRDHLCVKCHITDLCYGGFYHHNICMSYINLTKPRVLTRPRVLLCIIYA